jgi:hypothetical protein
MAVPNGFFIDFLNTCIKSRHLCVNVSHSSPNETLIQITHDLTRQSSGIFKHHTPKYQFSSLLGADAVADW